MTKPEHIIKGDYDNLENCNPARVPATRFGGSRVKNSYLATIVCVCVCVFFCVLEGVCVFVCVFVCVCENAKK